MTTTRDVTAVEAENTQLATRNADLIHSIVELQTRLDATLDAYHKAVTQDRQQQAVELQQEKEARGRAEAVARAAQAQRKAAHQWKRDSNPATQAVLTAAIKATDAALAAWAEFEVGE